MICLLTEKKIIYLVYFLPISLFIGSTISNLTIILIVVFFCFDHIKYKTFNILKDKILPILSIYIYLILNAIFISQNVDSMVRAIGFIRFPLLAFALAYYFSLHNNKYQDKIIKAWFVIYIIVTIDIIFEFIVGYNLLGLKSTYPGRIASFTGDEMKIGAYFYGFLIFSFFFLQKHFDKQKYLFLFLFLITALLIGERSNLLKFFILTLALFLFIDKKFFWRKIFTIISFIIIGSIIIKFVPAIKSRFVHHLYSSSFAKVERFNIENLVKVNLHINHYHTAVQVFKKNLLFGVGIKNFRNESYKIEYNPIEGVNGGGNHPHQLHFEILSELGIVGYILIFGTMLYLIIKNIKILNKTKNIYLIGSILFILVSLVPILPSGSFFTSYSAAFFWIGFSFLIKFKFI